MKKYRFHFVGICGVSMSALALYLKNKKFYVQGSDISNNQVAKNLKKHGIKVFLGHDAKNIKNVDIVIYNFAIDKENVEILQAQKQNLIIISRAQLLGEISKNFKNVIAISGSHGKTSTTAMLYSCLKVYNPTLHLGGMLVNDEFGLIQGNGDFFITEACEYHNSFLNLQPNISIILNVEPEHLDFFGNFDNELKSFKQFSNQSKICISQDKTLFNSKYTFGEGQDFCAKNIQINGHIYSYDCYFKNKFYMHVDLGAVGIYNITNSLSVIAVCHCLNIEKEQIYQGLKNYVGVKRRFEIIKTNPYIVHDYAHHPTEIKRTLQTFREVVENKKILVVFQPHTYSRTQLLFNKFLQCFDVANEIMIIKTYSAREKYNKNGSAFKLYKSLKTTKKCYYCANFDYAIKKIQHKLSEDFNVIVLGAGDVDKIAYYFK